MNAAGAQVLQLPSVIDLDGMDEVRDWLVEATGHGAVELRAGAVERCATNALLMLQAAAQTARNNGFSMKITNPSPALKDAIVRLGMVDIYSDVIEEQ